MKTKNKETNTTTTNNDIIQNVVRSGCTKCANCREDIVIRDENTIKIMYGGREQYTCSKKCMWDFYK